MTVPPELIQIVVGGQVGLPLYLTPFQVSVLVALAIHSTAFHILFGSRRFFTCALIGAAAFLVGHFLSERIVAQAFLLGGVHIVEASLLSWMAMIGARRAFK